MERYTESVLKGKQMIPQHSMIQYRAVLQTSAASYCAPLLASEVVAPHVNSNARGLADLTLTQSDRFASFLNHAVSFFW